MSGPEADGDDWERHSQWWVAGFTDGADSEYEEQILPLAAAELSGASRVLDLGCGEGQISRLAAAGGARAFGVDTARNQLSVALDRAGGAFYAQASVGELPFPDGTFDAAMASLVLEHVEELDAVVAEVGRVLAAGGVCCCFLNHPMAQAPGSGLVDDHTVDPPETYWRLGSYLVEQSAVERVEAGVWLRFVHRPLGRYVNSFADAGLLLERMVEPPPLPGSFTSVHDADVGTTVPRLLYLRFRKAR